MVTKAKKVGAPLAVLIILGIFAAAVLVLVGITNPVNAIIGLILATIAMVVVLLAYLWLDRWEPEPPRLLIFAFLWGAAVAVIGALLIGALFGVLGILSGEFTGVAIQAPLVEESLKGLLLLIMLTGRRRAEMNSLTDCLVYAGMVGAGFAWVEDILYIGTNDNIGGALFTAALRLIMGPFAHPLFTSMTALGIYFSMRQRSTGAKVGCILAGFLGAMLLHGLWNGSSALVNGWGYFIVYLLVMIPVFVLMIIIAVKSRKREQQMVAAKLPGMVQAGLVRPKEVPWLSTLANRKLAINHARQVGGPDAAKAVKVFAAAVVELAFVRDRIDRGFGNDKIFAHQQEAAQGVVFARQQAPVLYQLDQLRLPAPPGVGPGPQQPWGGPPPPNQAPGHRGPG